MSVSETETSLVDGLVDALLVLAGIIMACWFFAQTWDYSWSFIAV